MASATIKMLLVLVLVQLLLVPPTCFGQSFAPTTPVTVIKVGFVTSIGNSYIGTDTLAAFLTAASVMNADPLTYLGRANVRVEPYWMAPLFPGDVLRLGAMRSVMRLTSSLYEPFNETTGPTRVAAIGSNESDPNVDVVITGGGNSGVLVMAPITEFNSKPAIGVVAAGDSLSDKARTHFNTMYYLVQGVVVSVYLMR